MQRIVQREQLQSANKSTTSGRFVHRLQLLNTTTMNKFNGLRRLTWQLHWTAINYNERKGKIGRKAFREHKVVEYRIYLLAPIPLLATQLFDTGVERVAPYVQYIQQYA